MELKARLVLPEAELEQFVENPFNGIEREASTTKGYKNAPPRIHSMELKGNSLSLAGFGSP